MHAWVGQIVLNCDVFKDVIRPYPRPSSPPLCPKNRHGSFRFITVLVAFRQRQQRSECRLRPITCVWFLPPPPLTSISHWISRPYVVCVNHRPQSQYAWAICLAVGSNGTGTTLNASWTVGTNTPQHRLTWSHRVAFRAAGRANAAYGSRREQRSRRSVERKPGPTCQTGEVENQYGFLGVVHAWVGQTR